jgi:hypothetical protein
MLMDMSKLPVEVLIGTLQNLDERPRISYFDPTVVKFLITLSSSLMNDLESRKHADVMAFAFWIRKSNLEIIVSKYQADRNRVGYGVCLHIAPANVPLNFAYSLVSSLLAGNRNVVRLPTNIYPQATFLIEKLQKILGAEEFQDVAHSTCIIRYEKSDDTTEKLLSFANLKIIWGGDSTIRAIRSINTPAHCKEVIFPDRKSISVINVKSIHDLSMSDLKKLCEKFYTDSYLFDQNACSSPKIVFWLTSGGNSLEIRDKFWQAFLEVVKTKYVIEPRNLLLKFTELSHIVATSNQNLAIGAPGSLLSVLRFEPNAEPFGARLVNRFGAFFQDDLEQLEDLAFLLDYRIQTITYFGVEPKKIADFVMNSRLQGVDRIVPIGTGLDFDFIWDGYDLPRSLSRSIKIN